MKQPKSILLLIISLFLVLDQAAARDARQAAETEQIRSWTVPVYATKSDGSPWPSLSEKDLEIFLNGKKISDFTLRGKGVKNIGKTNAPSTQVEKSSDPSRKMVYLVFDSASLPYNLLARTKKIATTVLSQWEGKAKFIVMGIEPYAGLKIIFGPSSDVKEIKANIERYISSRKGSHLQSRVADASEIRDIYPKSSQVSQGEITRPELKRMKDADRVENRQVSSAILTSLTTLNVVLRRFAGYSKIVHLYSIGIPAGAMENQSFIYFDEQDRSSVENIEIRSLDRATYDLIKSAGQSFKKNASLLFLINPAGTRVRNHDPDSGEMSLSMLAKESGGRYFEGPDDEIAQTLIAMEQGYYEVTFSDQKEIEGPEIEVEIRSRVPEIIIHSVKNVSRGKSFREMTPLEREAFILNILTEGPFVDSNLKVQSIKVELKPAGEAVILIAQLPSELSHAEWDIYKVWRKPAEGKTEMQKDHMLTESPRLEFAMTVKQGYILDAVLVHSRTGTVFICQR
jgi:hypothetical protein